MAKSFYCDIVSAEKEIYSGSVTLLSLRGGLGELCILPGHAPLLTNILPGTIRLLCEEEGEHLIFASGGFLEVQPGKVTVLADAASKAEGLDEKAALKAKQEAEALLSESHDSEVQYSQALTMLAEASARVRTLEELKKRRR